MVGNCEKMLLISSPSNEWSELVHDEVGLYFPFFLLLGINWMEFPGIIHKHTMHYTPTNTIILGPHYVFVC